MIPLLLILLLAAGAACAAAVWPMGTYCVLIALAGPVLAVMSVRLAEAGVVPMAALLAAGGVASVVVGVAAALAEPAPVPRAAHAVAY